jgi:hypothetical protein
MSLRTERRECDGQIDKSAHASIKSIRISHTAKTAPTHSRSIDIAN